MSTLTLLCAANNSAGGLTKTKPRLRIPQRPLLRRHHQSHRGHPLETRQVDSFTRLPHRPSVLARDVRRCVSCLIKDEIIKSTRRRASRNRLKMFKINKKGKTSNGDSNPNRSTLACNHGMRFNHVLIQLTVSSLNCRTRKLTHRAVRRGAWHVGCLLPPLRAWRSLVCSVLLIVTASRVMDGAPVA